MEDRRIEWIAIALLVALAILLLLAFLGFLPSMLSTDLAAHDRKNDKLLQVNQVTCAYLAHMAKADPLKCYNPPEGYIAVGAR